MRAYYFDNLPGDQRLPHDYVPSQPVSPDTLTKLGLEFWSIPVDGDELTLDAIAQERGWTSRDTYNVSKEGLGDVSISVINAKRGARELILYFKRRMKILSRDTSKSTWIDWYRDDLTLLIPSRSLL